MIIALTANSAHWESATRREWPKGIIVGAGVKSFRRHLCGLLVHVGDIDASGALDSLVGLCVCLCVVADTSLVGSLALDDVLRGVSRVEGKKGRETVSYRTSRVAPRHCDEISLLDIGSLN